MSHDTSTTTYAHAHELKMAGLRVDPRSPLANLMTRRYCLRCARHYTERDNLGAWRCSYHPGHMVGTVAIDEHAPRNTYSCCGGADTRKGCTRCDHVSTPGKFHEESMAVDEDHVRIIVPHLLAANALSVYPGVVRCAQTAEIAIFRYAPSRSCYAYADVYDVPAAPDYGASTNAWRSPVSMSIKQTLV